MYNTATTKQIDLITYLITTGFSSNSIQSFAHFRFYTFELKVESKTKRIKSFDSADELTVFLLCKRLTDPIDCSDCHLTWLMRDNRRLLTTITGGTCADGTAFFSLDPNGYADCPVTITFD